MGEEGTRNAKTGAFTEKERVTGLREREILQGQEYMSHVSMPCFFLLGTENTN